MTWAVLRSPGQLFCRMPPSWKLSALFPMIRPELWVWGRKTPEVSTIFITPNQGHVLLTRFLTVDVDMVTWPSSSVSGVSPAKLLFPLLFLSSLDRSHSAQPPLQERGAVLHLLEGGVITCMIHSSEQEICPFSPIVNFAQPFVSV